MKRVIWFLALVLGIQLLNFAFVHDKIRSIERGREVFARYAARCDPEARPELLSPQIRRTTDKVAIGQKKASLVP